MNSIDRHQEYNILSVFQNLALLEKGNTSGRVALMYFSEMNSRRKMLKVLNYCVAWIQDTFKNKKLFCHFLN